MGKMSKRKGYIGEKEAINILQKEIDYVYKKNKLEPIQLNRNLMQTISGGYDVIGLDWLALEIKRCECLRLDDWWEQCIKQAKNNKEPVLMYRKNRANWRIRMLGTFGIKKFDDMNDTIVDISLHPFLYYLKKRCQLDIDNKL